MEIIFAPAFQCSFKKILYLKQSMPQIIRKKIHLASRSVFNSLTTSIPPSYKNRWGTLVVKGIKFCLISMMEIL